MIEFIRGIRTPVSTTSIPASLKTVSDGWGNLLSRSRSRIRNRARQSASWRSMTRFFAACTTQEVVGCAVAPRIRTRRLACSITASTYIRAPDKVTVSKKSQANKRTRRSTRARMERTVGGRPSRWVWTWRRAGG
jgi:hypothetical protein